VSTTTTEKLEAELESARRSLWEYMRFVVALGGGGHMAAKLPDEFGAFVGMADRAREALGSWRPPTKETTP